jgi:hypothetical protein
MGYEEIASYYNRRNTYRRKPSELFEQKNKTCQETILAFANTTPLHAFPKLSHHPKKSIVDKHLPLHSSPSRLQTTPGSPEMWYIHREPNQGQ